jgi:hypothetical protein
MADPDFKKYHISIASSYGDAHIQSLDMRRSAIGLCMVGVLSSATIPDSLRGSLTFHASFDRSLQADTARGDRQIYHAPGYKEQAQAKPGFDEVDVALESGAGVGGSGALRFRSKNTRALFFKGDRNVKPESGTLSFWLRLDPQKDLAPGFTDPIQITDKAYNDSAIWVDFSKDEVPRHFRLGVFGALKAWNPKDTPPDKNPDFMQRLIVVERPPFSGDQWTHIAITWSGLSSPGGTASLFINGKRIGPARTIKETFDWDAARLGIRLGVNYIGRMDEVAAFDRALSEREVASLHTSVKP